MKKGKFIACVLSAVMVITSVISTPAVISKAAASVPTNAALFCCEDFHDFAASAQLNEASARAGSTGYGASDRQWVQAYSGSNVRGGQAKTGTSVGTDLAGQIYTKNSQPIAGSILKINNIPQGYEKITLSYDRRVYNADNASEYAQVEWSDDSGASWNIAEKIGDGISKPALDASTKTLELSGAGGKTSIWVRFSAVSPTPPASYGVNFAFDNITLFGEASAPVVTPVTDKPTVSAAVYANRIDLSWNTVANAVYYTVKQSAASTGGFSEIATNISASNYSVTGLNSNTTYYFTVCGNNSAGAGPDSEVYTATTSKVEQPTVPVITAAPSVTANSGDKKVDLLWNTVENATYYKVSMSQSASGPFIQVDGNVTATSYTVNNLTNGTTYYFVVNANNETSSGPLSSVVSAAPVGVQAAQQTVLYDEQFKDYPSTVSKPGSDYSTWKPGGIYGPGAVAASTWVKPSGWNRDASLQSSGYSTGAPSGRVAHVYAPDLRQCGMELTVPNGTANYKDITVSYDRAAYYPKTAGGSHTDDYMAVQWSIDGSNWNDAERITKAEGTTIDGKLILAPWGKKTVTLPAGANNSPTLKIRFFIQSPTDTNGTGAALNIDWAGVKISGTYVIQDAPKITYGKSRDGYADFAWEAVTGAKSYTIKMGTSADKLDMVYDNIADTAYSVKNLTNDVTYYYTITAVGDGGEGPASVIGTVTPKKVVPDAPSNAAAQGGYQKVKLSWDLMDITDYYSVKMSTSENGPFETKLTNITDTKCEISGLLNGTTYYFVVTGTNVVGESSNSTVISAAPTAAVTIPANIKTISKDRSVDISWDMVLGAKNYELYRSEDGNTYSLISNTIESNSFTDTGLINYKTYYYKLAAFNDENKSAQSEAASVIPVPKPEAVSGVAAAPYDKKVTVSWNPAKDALSYNVKIGTAAGNYISIIKDITDTSYTVTGLTNDTTYYIAVSASNYNGEGNNSAEITATPKSSPAIPGSVSAVVNENGIKLSWGAVSSAVSYKILTRSSVIDSYTLLAENITTNSYNFVDAVPSKPYLFVIVAVNQYGQSGSSGEVSAVYGPAMTIDSSVSSICDINVYDYTNYGGWSTKSNFGSGVKAYSDQSYLVTSTDDLFKGMDWIQPAAASKSYGGSVLTSFTVTGTVSVYAAFDKRSLTNGGTTFPAWVAADGWEQISNSFTVNNDLKYIIVKKTFNAGDTVKLGNNGGAGYLNYMVLMDYTSEVGFEVSNVKFTDNSGNTVDSLKASEELFAGVSIYNKLDAGKSLTLVVALYDKNNTLVRYSSLVCKLNPMESSEFRCGFMLPDNVDGCKIKAFVVNSIDEFRTVYDKNTAVLK